VRTRYRPGGLSPPLREDRPSAVALPAAGALPRVLTPRIKRAAGADLLTLSNF
jgi:hypothetical protein